MAGTVLNLYLILAWTSRMRGALSRVCLQAICAVGIGKFRSYHPL